MVTRGVASNARRMARMLYAVLVGDSLPLAGHNAISTASSGRSVGIRGTASRR